MTLADEILAAAELLAESGATEGAYRRSVSSAYYAAFHALIDAAVDLILKPPIARERGRRLFAHTEMMLKVCKTYSTTPKPGNNDRAYLNALALYGQLQRPRSEVLEITAAFVQLHQLREHADYVVTPGVTHSQALC